MFGGMGTAEMLIIGIIALLLFGKRLPEVAKNLGKSFTEFKRGMTGIEDDVKRNVYADPAPSSSRPVQEDEEEELTAPKFEPPIAATPTTVPASNEAGVETTESEESTV